MNSIACEVTREEKVFIWEKFRELTEYYSFTTQHKSEHSSYPNLYYSRGTLDETSHSSNSIAGKRYFIWVSLTEFKRILTNRLIEKRKVKV